MPFGYFPPSAGGGGGVTDHGALTGLSDDDHAIYHTNARGDARYYPQATADATFEPLGQGAIEADLAVSAHAALDEPHANMEIVLVYDPIAGEYPGRPAVDVPVRYRGSVAPDFAGANIAAGGDPPNADDDLWTNTTVA